MTRRILAALVGGAIGAGVALPVAAATGHGWVTSAIGIGGALAALAIAERRKWIRTPEDLAKPTTLRAQGLEPPRNGSGREGD